MRQMFWGAALSSLILSACSEGLETMPSQTISQEATFTEAMQRAPEIGMVTETAETQLPVFTKNNFEAIAKFNFVIAQELIEESDRSGGANAALLRAADQSSCLGATALAAGVVRDDDAALLWEAMLTVQTDLRRSLHRDSVGMSPTTTGFLRSSANGTQGSNLTRTEQRLRATYRYTNAEDFLEKELFKCLAQVESAS